MKPFVVYCIRKRCSGVVRNGRGGTFCMACGAPYHPLDPDPTKRQKPKPLGWSK